MKKSLAHLPERKRAELKRIPMAQVTRILLLMPKAAIRIIQCSAGAGGSGGNEKSVNRRQQQQKSTEGGLKNKKK